MSVNQQNWWVFAGQVREGRNDGWAKRRSLRNWLRKRRDRFFAWLVQPGDSIVLIEGELLRKDGDDLWAGGGSYHGARNGRPVANQERAGRINDLFPEAFREDGTGRDLELAELLL